MRLREIVYLLLGLLIGVLINAGKADTRISFMVGSSQGSPSADGIWWESAYPTNNRLTSGSYSVGISHTFPNSLGLRADYGKILDYSADNSAIPNENAVAARQAGTVSCADGWQYCMTRWRGSGTVYGIHLGAFYDFNMKGLHIQPEAGPLIYQYSFQMRMDPLEVGAPSGPISRDAGAGVGTYMTGYSRLTLLYKWATVRFDYDHNVKGKSGVVGTQEGPIKSVLIGVSIPL